MFSAFAWFLISFQEFWVHFWSTSRNYDPYQSVVRQKYAYFLYFGLTVLVYKMGNCFCIGIWGTVWQNLCDFFDTTLKECCGQSIPMPSNKHVIAVEITMIEKPGNCVSLGLKMFQGCKKEHFTPATQVFYSHFVP